LLIFPPIKPVQSICNSASTDKNSSKSVVNSSADHLSHLITALKILDLLKIKLMKFYLLEV
jgi:hypothetical protein